MVALIGRAEFCVDAANTPLYKGDVHFNVGTASYNLSTITVTLVAGDTLATLQTKFLSAIDTEAQRLGTPAPTAVYGGSVAKHR